MKIIIINGPNLNLLGIREKEIYGNQTFEDFFEYLGNKYPTQTIDFYQSNHEGDIVDKIQEARLIFDAVIINAGAYTHSSIAIADAISSINIPVIEVHISNIFKREKFRHKSYLTHVCKGIISGCGLNSYSLAVESLLLDFNKD